VFSGGGGELQARRLADALDEIYELTSDTVADYDRCLEEVEAIPVQQSISSMTSLKVT